MDELAIAIDDENVEAMPQDAVSEAMANVAELTARLRALREDAARVVPTAAGAKLTLGEQIDLMKALKDLRAELGKFDKDVGSVYGELEVQQLATLDMVGITHARGSRASATISEQAVLSVTDWEAFHGFVLEQEAMELLQKRPANAACEEFRRVSGEEIPGTRWFTKRTISLKSL